MNRTGLAACLIVFACTSAAEAQHAVVVVRHAERADSASGGKGMMATDPDLSKEGRARAAELARILKDARITHIFTTQYKRTQQTAGPLATATGITPIVFASSDPEALTGAIRAARGTVLVVGHSNSVPELLKGLGVKEEILIGEEEFDNLFVVLPGSSPTLVRLRY